MRFGNGHGWGDKNSHRYSYWWGGCDRDRSAWTYAYFLILLILPTDGDRSHALFERTTLRNKILYLTYRI